MCASPSAKKGESISYLGDLQSRVTFARFLLFLPKESRASAARLSFSHDNPLRSEKNLRRIVAKEPL